KIMIGLFLCSTESNEVIETIKPEWNKDVNMSIEEKCSTLNLQSSIFKTFPWKEELSLGIDHKEFCKSFFIQPDLFLRLRSGKEKLVKEKLNQANIDFR